ncbi:hypothetical protein BH23BAC2_BH23BAC2_12750 [soil metagenome]
MASFAKKHTINFFILILGCAIYFGIPQTAFAQSIPNPLSTQTQEEAAPTFPEDSLGRRTPSGTVSGFINSVSRQNYDRAARFLNLRKVRGNNNEPERLVRAFQTLLDRGGNIMPYTWLSDDYDGRQDDELAPEVDRVGSVRAGDQTIDLFVEKTKGSDGGPIWLFSSATVSNIAALDMEDFSWVERIFPDLLMENMWGGVPIGQWLAAVLLAVISFLIAWGLIAIIILSMRLVWRKARTDPTRGIIKALAFPFQLYLAVWLLINISLEAGLSIIIRQRFSGIILVVAVIAFLILLWRLSDYIGRYSKRKMTEKGNFSGVSVILFLQRAAKIAIVIFGVIAVLLNLGYDVTTGLAALGIGGLALALGAQKTMENFVGSVSLIADQPVRIGDFCKVGTTVGTVEKIGMRSTRIRTINRTVVTIPNGQFSSETIENYAHRDRFFFGPTLDLRYETSPDQIRYLLVEVRSMLYSHPMVINDTARVRLIELGESSIKLEVFSYIETRQFEVFLEVKEDLLLRIMDIVTTSGTEFAFPSQTIYMARDKGLSREKTEQAEDKVKNWKENNEMQIPAFDEEKIESLKNTLKYPPEGSVKRKEEGEELF